jgi:hypothetical protein
MKCPDCNQFIGSVFVKSECLQRAYLADMGSSRRIIDYDAPEILKTIKILCPKCDCDLSGQIQQ